MSAISSPGLASRCVKPIVALRQRLGARVGRHDDDDVAEVGLAAVVVGQRAVVHHLQQDVEDVRVRLLDLVEQQHRVRLLGDRLGQQAALVEADVARRRADQARHRVALHVLGHVEADQLDAEDVGELLARPRSCRRRSGRRTGRSRSACRGLPRPERAILIADDQRVDRLVLAEDDALQVAVERLQRVAVVASTRCAGGMRAILATISSISVLPMIFFCLRLRQDALRGAGLVDHVDRLVGQVAVVDVARRQLGRRRAAPPART